MRNITLAFLIVLVATFHAHAGTKVTFRNDGICLVDGKPFFPIGIWTYEPKTREIWWSADEEKLRTVQAYAFCTRHERHRHVIGSFDICV